MLGALDSGSQISMRAPKTRSASKKMVVTQQGGSGSLSEHSAVITEFVKDCFKTVVDRLQLTDIDLEVKEKVIRLIF